MTIIAISESDFNSFGCPQCGCYSGYSMLTFFGTAADWRCNCGCTTLIVADGIEVAPVCPPGHDSPPSVIKHPLS